jgi:hypothetical protein
MGGENNLRKTEIGKEETDSAKRSNTQHLALQVQARTTSTRRKHEEAPTLYYRHSKVWTSLGHQKTNACKLLGSATKTEESRLLPNMRTKFAQQEGHHHPQRRRNSHCRWDIPGLGATLASTATIGDPYPLDQARGCRTASEQQGKGETSQPLEKTFRCDGGLTRSPATRAAEKSATPSHVARCRADAASPPRADSSPPASKPDNVLRLRQGGREEAREGNFGTR